jgi:hypothetical protein
MNESRYAHWPLYPRFVGALFTGRTVALPSPSQIGSLKGWGKDGLSAVINVATAQLDAQIASLDRVLSRAQLLFTTLLGLIALLFALAPAIWASQSIAWGEIIPRALLVLSGLLFLGALLGAAALIAVRKEFDGMSATVLSDWDKFDTERMASDYAECVGIGELTTNAHLTVFGTAVRLTLAGALLLGGAWLMGQFPPVP